MRIWLKPFVWFDNHVNVKEIISEYSSCPSYKCLFLLFCAVYQIYSNIWYRIQIKTNLTCWFCGFVYYSDKAETSCGLQTHLIMCQIPRISNEAFLGLDISYIFQQQQPWDQLGHFKWLTIAWISHFSLVTCIGTSDETSPDSILKSW